MSSKGTRGVPDGKVGCREEGVGHLGGRANSWWLQMSKLSKKKIAECEGADGK